MGFRESISYSKDFLTGRKIEKIKQKLIMPVQGIATVKLYDDLTGKQVYEAKSENRITAVLANIAFVVIDYLTGIMASILEQKLSSEVGFRGIFKKILIFVLVGVANIIDSYLISSGNAIRTTVIFFYISNEGISILENATRIGLPVPDKLKNILEQLKEENKNG
ncbi:phage holin family protein [Clostridium tetani]|uniref:phage holin family protein n=1 Tax=Clostridium tetani TaxID=1513 RepID=UPI000AD2148D|nr:phage holin family protein [Clostridium tetani]BDR76139.1 hypothetical protein K154306013_17990 [Clostridium tetani]